MTITKEGALASFYTVNKAPIKHLKVYFNPKLSGSGDPSLENVREISGWNGINLYHTGKNVLNCPGTATITMNIDITSRVTLPPGTYTFSMDIINNSDIKGMVAVRLNTSYSNYILERFNGNFQGKFSMNFTLTETSDVRINLGGEKAGYSYVISNRMISQETNTNFNTYLGTSIPIDWANDIGTVYGGYIDLITGQLQNEYYSLKLTNDYNDYITRVTKFSDYDIYYFQMSAIDVVPELDTDVPHMLCDAYKVVSWQERLDNPRANILAALIVSGGYTRIFFFTEKNKYNSVEDFIASCVNCTVLFKRETVDTSNITSQQLQTFIGRNNIWSNADKVEVEYELAESNDELYRRRNIILRGYPHIETASGNIASFLTDMAAPVKDAKIYFNPILEGEGDPSPENIRPINGLQSIELNYTNKNLLGGEVLKNKIANLMPNISINSTDGIISYNNADAANHLGEILYDKFKPNTRYTFIVTYSKDVNRYIHLRFDYSDGTYSMMSRGANITVTDKTTEVFISTANKTVVSISRLADEYSTVNLYYNESGLFEGVLTANLFELSDNQIIPINWANDIGTIYSGYVDLIKGELIETYQYSVLNNPDDWIIHPNLSRVYAYDQHIFPIDYSKGNAHGLLCTIAPAAGGNTNYPFICRWYNENEYNYCVLRYANNLENPPTLEDIKELASNNQIAITYELATPIHHPLTPQTLKTLKGVNNIWSDANGPIEVQYWTY